MVNITDPSILTWTRGGGLTLAGLSALGSGMLKVSAGGTLGLGTAGNDYITPVNPAPDNLSYSGVLITATAGENVAIGDACFLKSDGKYWLAKADVATTKMPCVAMATGTINANASGVFLLWGYIRSDAGWGGALTIGALMYVSITGTTGNTTTTTAPNASGNIVQVIGQAVAARIVFFAPCYTQVTVT